MNRYRIINTVSGSDLGIFDAADEQGALDAMVREAGYKGATCKITLTA